MVNRTNKNTINMGWITFFLHTLYFILLVFTTHGSYTFFFINLLIFVIFFGDYLQGKSSKILLCIMLIISVIKLFNIIIDFYNFGLLNNMPIYVTLFILHIATIFISTSVLCEKKEIDINANNLIYQPKTYMKINGFIINIILIALVLIYFLVINSKINIGYDLVIYFHIKFNHINLINNLGIEVAFDVTLIFLILYCFFFIKSLLGFISKPFYLFLIIILAYDIYINLSIIPLLIDNLLLYPALIYIVIINIIINAYLILYNIFILFEKSRYVENNNEKIIDYSI